MKFFKWLNENRPQQKNSLSKLAKVVGADRVYREETADAIMALGNEPFSEEIFAFLTSVASTGRHSDTATLAIGTIGHPKTIEYLIGGIRYPGVFYKRNVKALSNPRNHLAVRPLLEIALTSNNYISVESAVQILAAIDTQSARDALAQFRTTSSRIVAVLWDGFETPEPISTTFLGQRPSDHELNAAHNKLVRKNIFSFGSDEEAFEALACCMTAPQSAPLSQLEVFLAKSVQHPRAELGRRKPGIARAAGVSDLPAQAFDVLISRATHNSDKRVRDVRERLATADKTKLEAHLLIRLEADRERAERFYRLLPNRSDISKLQDLQHSFQSEDDIPVYLAELRQRDLRKHRLSVEGEVDEARAHPEDAEARLAAFGNACRLDIAYGLSLLTEFVEPLLAGGHWAIRKKTLGMLSEIQSAAVCQLLENYIADEQDYELQAYARATLQALIQKIGAERQP